MESKGNNKIRNNKTNTSTPPEDKEPKTAFGRFFSKVGYSIWIAVMVVGGIIAFLVSLLVL